MELSVEKKPVQLNLGGGTVALVGVINVDKFPHPNVDIVHDLEVFPWPFEDNSVDQASFIHVLEHLHNHIGVMNEVYRILVPNGVVNIRGPHARSSGAWQDPTHTRPLPEEWFLYFDSDFRKAQRIIYAGIKCDFKMFDASYTLHEDYQKLKNEGKLTDQQLAIEIVHKFNVATEFLCRLRAVK